MNLYQKYSEGLKVKDNVFTEEIKKVALSSNDDKRMQSTGSTECCKGKHKRTSSKLATNS